MKYIVTFILIFSAWCSIAQDAGKAQLAAFKKANNYIYEGNTLIKSDDFVAAEMAYRKAISKQASNIAGNYNLGNSYYNKGNFEEALYRHQQAAVSANTKPEKHRAFHNIGNTLMQNEKYAEAVEAYKQALRNNPTDDETRYNLAVAKKKQKEQEDKQDKNKDNKDKEDKDNKDDKENEDKKENEDNKDKEGKDNKDENKDKGDQEKKEDDKKDDDGKPKDEKDDKGKKDEEKEKEQPKPQQGRLSPQQIKNLLEAMNNQEKKVQEKMDAKKLKGVKVKTEKDW